MTEWLADLDRQAEVERRAKVEAAADATIAKRHADAEARATAKLKHQNATRASKAAGGRAETLAAMIWNMADAIGEVAEHLKTTRQYSTLPLRQRQKWETAFIEALHADLARAGVPGLNASDLRKRDGLNAWATKLKTAIEREGTDL
jgi:hypothetical protein